MRTLTLIACLAFALCTTGCGTPDGPSTGPGPQPPLPQSDGGAAVALDAGAQSPLDGALPPSPPPPPPPQDAGSSCAPPAQYNGAAEGKIDATIPLLGPMKMPVECVVKFTVQGSKATGTIQVMDPVTKKPWSYAPKPFTFESNVNCNQMTGPLKGNIVALGMQIAFSGSVEGTWDGATFTGKWSGGANAGVTAKGGGTWTAKP